MNRKATRKKKRKYVCVNHPARIAAVHHEEYGYLCWQCHYKAVNAPAGTFERRFGPDFYEPGGPGYAEDY